MSVKEIIDKWDPIDLLSHAPDDEYHSEIREIEGLLRKSPELESLAEGIRSVFDQSFRGHFSRTRDECRDVARLLLIDAGSRSPEDR